MLVCILYGYLAFAEFGYRQTDTISEASTWFKMGSAWPVVIAAYLHFFLIFTKRTSLQSRRTSFVLYMPALVFSVIGLTTSFVSGVPTREYWGWTYSVPETTVVYNLTALWALFLTFLSFTIILLYFLRAREPLEKKRATYVFLGMLAPLVVGFLTEGVFPSIDVKVPELATTASALGYIVIAYGIYKYNLFALTPAVAAQDIVAAMSNFLFLVKMDGHIVLANQSALDILGYTENELTGKPLKTLFAEKEKMQEIITMGADFSGEMTVVTKDGGMIPGLVSLSVVRDKAGNHLGMLIVGSDLTDHKRAEEAHKKELLLKEIHHRVKNNMQIISSLLRLQSRYITNKKYQEMFTESQNRIRSMALVHEKLYQSGDLENINFTEYITDMVNNLVQSYGSQDVAVNMEKDDIWLGVDTAVPCGLIVNELVTNVLKHAFPDRKGEITVNVRGFNKTVELVIADNGVGIPDGIDFRTTETLGLQLVSILAEDQLGGEIQLIKNKGTEFRITFKAEKK
jgi:PAS domain S-box-containing protein